MKIDLTDVTVCAVDSVNVRPAAMALNRSVARCRFADAVLFSHEPASGSFRTIKIDKIESTTAYSHFVFKRLPMLIETPFVLVVQWDGFVIDQSAWNPSFRNFDYIGARWPFVTDGLTVGNGGFSLLSRKFMLAMVEPRFPIRDGENSDWLICRKYRPQLETEFDIRFAPEAIADRFSYETLTAQEFTTPRPPTFGFHGMGNMWRYLDDADMIALIDQVSPYVFQTPQCAILVATYFMLGRFEVFAALYARMKAHAGDAVLGMIQTAIGENDAAGRCAAIGDQLTRHIGAARSLSARLMQVRRRASLGVAHLRGQKSPFEI